MCCTSCGGPASAASNGAATCTSRPGALRWPKPSGGAPARRASMSPHTAPITSSTQASTKARPSRRCWIPRSPLGPPLSACGPAPGPRQPPIRSTSAGRRRTRCGSPTSPRRRAGSYALSTTRARSRTRRGRRGSFWDWLRTDPAGAGRQLLGLAAHPAVFSLWQDPVGESPEECASGIRAVIARLHHVHVYYWWPDPSHRLVLADGEERWKGHLRLLAASARNLDLLLEFLPGDSPELLDGEAATLRRWLSEIGEPPPV